MASSNQFLITFTIVAIVLPTVALATEYTVGDDSGWTVGFNYSTWAKDKEFKVGDTLVFNYPVGRHNVFKVNGTTFKTCAIPPSNEALATGSDKITLATPGNKWYFCGVASHCLGGQKLAISVSPAMEAPAPAPSSSNGIATSAIHVLFAVIICSVMVIMG
ncbi:hypothetical protein ACHQM5_013269 [Ranunculus cassubicifolius]